MTVKFSKEQLLVLVGAALFQCALIGVLMNSTGVFLAQIRMDLGLSMTRVSVHNTIRSIAGALGGAFLVRMFFRTHKAKFMMGTILVIVLGYLLLIIGADTWLWYVVPVFVSPTASIGIIAVPYILNPWFPENAGAATGLALAFSGVGGIVFNPVAAFLIEKLGWRMAILILGAVTIVFALIGIGLIFRRKPPREVEAEQEEKIGIRKEKGRSCTKKTFLLCCICMLGGGICTQLVNYISMYIESIGYSLTVGAIMTSFVMAGNIGGKLLFGILSDLAGVWKAMLFGLLCVAVGAMGLVMAREQPLLLSAAALLYGSCYAISTIAVSRCCIKAYGAEGGKAYSGIHTSINSAVGALSSFGAGALFDMTESFTPIFLIGATACVLSILAVAMINRGNSSKISSKIYAKKLKSC